MAGGTTPSHVGRLHWVDRRLGGRRIGRARPGTSGARRHADADAQPRVRPTACREGPGSRVRIAIVGGTGPFGIRARDALGQARLTRSSSARGTQSAPNEARTRARGRRARRTPRPFATADLVVLATKAEADPRHRARAPRGDRLDHRCSRVASELQLHLLRCSSDSRGHLVWRSGIQAELDCPVLAGLAFARSAGTLASAEPRTRTRSSAGTTQTRRTSRARSRRATDLGACARRRSAGECARAWSGHDGGDRESEQAIPRARRPSCQRPPLTGELHVIPLRGIPELGGTGMIWGCTGG